jgi:glyoxylase-like metal-dependent hydrolase (beta-lactamase superfamily II)
MTIKKIDFESIYFDLYELNRGIYAAISQDKMPSSNAGFFNLGNYLIIFDTLMDPFATVDLIKASKQFTNKEPSFLINSHYHVDHLFGNRRFNHSIPIISSSQALIETEEYLKTRWNDFKGRASVELEKIEKELPNETDPDKILEMNNDIKTWNEIKDPNFTFRLPDIIIDNSITINGTEKNCELIYIGEAHTKGDIIAFFEKERISFMGDLLFAETDPTWATAAVGAPTPANPERLRDFLIEYSEKDIEVYVPGHGKLCTKKELKENAEFFEEYFIKGKN